MSCNEMLHDFADFVIAIKSVELPLRKQRDGLVHDLSVAERQLSDAKHQEFLVLQELVDKQCSYY